MYEDDYSLTSEQRFERLINRSSNSNYMLNTHYTLGTLTPVFRPDGRNTQVLIIPTRPGKTPIPVTYWRNHPNKILEMMADAEIEYFTPPVAPFMTSDVVALINQHLNLQLTAAEYVNESFPNAVSGVNIHFTNGSFAWLPESITIALMGDGDRITEEGELRITEDDQVRVVE